MGLTVSVVTTVLNDRDGMRRLLASLESQEAPMEIVVVDAGSTDGTMDVLHDASKRMPLHVIQKKGPRGEGFHTAATAANGDVLAFIGADDTAEPGWVAAVRRAFQDPKVSVVVGTNVLSGDGPKVERVPWVVDGQDISHPGCNTSYRTSTYRELGGIDPSFVTAEDMELNLRAVRAGHQIVHAPAAVVRRTVRAGGRVLHQAYWNGYGRGQLRRKHGDLPGMRRGALRSAINPLNLPRLAAGYLGYRKGKRSTP